MDALAAAVHAAEMETAAYAERIAALNAELKRAELIKRFQEAQAEIARLEASTAAKLDETQQLKADLAALTKEKKRVVAARARQKKKKKKRARKLYKAARRRMYRAPGFHCAMRIQAAEAVAKMDQAMEQLELAKQAAAEANEQQLVLEVGEEVRLSEALFDPTWWVKGLLSSQH
jgi:hypothetical protein